MRILGVTRFDAPRAIRLPSIDELATQGRVVLFREEALGQMLEHARKGEPLEVIGALLGFPALDAASRLPITYVDAIVPYEAEATRAHVAMRLSSYADLTEVRERTGMLQVGYYHSHPGHGIFQSSTDLRNFADYHPESYQLAIVVDSTRQRGAIESLDSSWLGIFVWEGPGRPTRMPARDIYLLRTRPNLLDTSGETAVADAPTQMSAGPLNAPRARWRWRLSIARVLRR